MPKKLEEIRKAVWDRIKGKTNPRTKKPYTESDAWAIATSQFKRSQKSLAVFTDDEEGVDVHELMLDTIQKIEEGED